MQKYSVFPIKPALKDGHLRKLEKDAFVSGVEISGRREKNANVSARVFESVLQSRTTSTGKKSASKNLQTNRVIKNAAITINLH
jgi:hypothetical protein